MRLISVVLLFPAVAFAGSQDRQVPPFTSVHVSSGMHANVSIGAQKLHVEADDQVLSILITEVVDGELRVHYPPNTNLRGEHEVHLTIQTPQLHGVGASGGSEVRAAFTRCDQADLQASGGSVVKATGVDARSFRVHASGGSILETDGAADAAEVQLSGGSQLHGRNFSARDVSVQGSGGSEAQFKATGKLSGALSGGSQLHVSGGAQTRVATSGGSEVTAD